MWFLLICQFASTYATCPRFLTSQIRKKEQSSKSSTALLQKKLMAEGRQMFHHRKHFLHIGGITSIQIIFIKHENKQQIPILLRRFIFFPLLLQYNAAAALGGAIIGRLGSSVWSRKFYPDRGRWFSSCIKQGSPQGFREQLKCQISKAQKLDLHWLFSLWWPQKQIQK